MSSLLALLIPSPVRFYCWLVRVSLLITSGTLNILSQEMLRAPKAFGSFMIIRPTLECRHWWEIVYIRMLSGRYFFMTSLHVPAIESTTQRHICLYCKNVLEQFLQVVSSWKRESWKVPTPQLMHPFSASRYCPATHTTNRMK